MGNRPLAELFFESACALIQISTNANVLRGNLDAIYTLLKYCDFLGYPELGNRIFDAVHTAAKHHDFLDFRECLYAIRYKTQEINNGN